MNFSGSKQSEATEAKIQIYDFYIYNYLIKVLMQFGRVFIADLFCGPGKQLSKKGSPLVLLDDVEKVLQIPKIKEKESQVFILFNDKNNNAVQDLKKEIDQKGTKKGIHIFEPQNLDFFNVIKDIEEIKDENLPKFFFLDPYGYSDYDLAAVKKILDFKFSEILLFVPASFIRRFSGSKKVPFALLNFVKEFADGNRKYGSVRELDESILKKLRENFPNLYIKNIEIKNGRNINTLFFLTKNIYGAILMIKLVDKETDGEEILDPKLCREKARNCRIFNKNILERISCNVATLSNILEEKLKMGNLSNRDIIEITTRCGLKLIYAEEALKKLKNDNKISVKYLTNGKTKGFYVAEANLKVVPLCVISYNGAR